MSRCSEVRSDGERDRNHGPVRARLTLKKKGPISDGGTASLNKKSSGSSTMSFKKLFDRM
jgi:hypothetical protein